jgi:hypothetical protein
LIPDRWVTLAPTAFGGRTGLALVKDSRAAQLIDASGNFGEAF